MSRSFLFQEARMTDFNPDDVHLSSGHFIDGQFVSASGQAMGIKRPSDGQHYAEIHEADARTVDDAVTVAEARRISSGWSGCSPRERGAALSRWADLIEKTVNTWRSWKPSDRPGPSPMRAISKCPLPRRPCVFMPNARTNTAATCFQRSTVAWACWCLSPMG